VPPYEESNPRTSYIGARPASLWSRDDIPLLREPGRAHLPDERRGKPTNQLEYSDNPVQPEPHRGWFSWPYGRQREAKKQAQMLPGPQTLKKEKKKKCWQSPLSKVTSIIALIVIITLLSFVIAGSVVAKQRKTFLCGHNEKGGPSCKAQLKSTDFDSRELAGLAYDGSIYTVPEILTRECEFDRGHWICPERPHKVWHKARKGEASKHMRLVKCTNPQERPWCYGIYDLQAAMMGESVYGENES
jgi:hypothetical protein